MNFGDEFLTDDYQGPPPEPTGGGQGGGDRWVDRDFAQAGVAGPPHEGSRPRPGRRWRVTYASSEPEAPEPNEAEDPFVFE